MVIGQQGIVVSDQGVNARPIKNNILENILPPADAQLGRRARAVPARALQRRQSKSLRISARASSDVEAVWAGGSVGAVSGLVIPSAALTS